ncbi:Fanconi-associated nuclease 1 homolog [Rhizoctonia solani AG-1 IB]|uniref:Fanconi-associated nuclease n=1 Tax=Thanatephorus cucumeris (strain AG1-IB / isolate 7/3/14) TaxID=1108050 RepID=M5BIP6_THACB|nr:Fanconi-associated nuclease 1 homolog [Rhizoctonia solani AG-1 IB]
MLFFRDGDFDPPVKVEESESSHGLLGAIELDGESIVQPGCSQPVNRGGSPIHSSQTEVLRSMYVTKLLEMINTVLEHESHLFTSSDITILNGIKRANYFQQYLISRFVQRKRGKWLRFDQLNERYTPEFRKFVAEADVPKTMADTLLDLSGHLHLKDAPAVSSGQTDVIDLTLDSDDEDACASSRSALGNPADIGDTADSAVQINSASEAVVFMEDTRTATPAQLLECLNFEELKLMGKRLKIPSKTKSSRDDTEQSETNSIMLSAILSITGKRNYPIYEYKRTADIFPTRTDLLRYMEISMLLNEVENILAGAGQPKGTKFDRLEASQDVINIWDKSRRDRGLERFEEGYLLTRLAYKAADCFGALKKYDMEIKLLAALLRQTRWRRSKRGSRPMLLRRLQRLEKQLRLPLDDQYIGEGDLKTAVETRIEGSRIDVPQTSASPSKSTDIGSNFSPSTGNDVVLMHPSGSPSVTPSIANGNPRPKRTGKSIWAGKEGEVNVETLALEYYAGLGFRGFHSEGAIVLTLFGLLFWDILFAPVLGAFETPYQSAPLDLAHDSFFSSREELINARLEELNNNIGSARQIVHSVYSREREREPWCVGVRWDLFENENDLMEVIECLGGPALAAICRLLAEEYGSRGGGVPDLFVWNTAEKTCKFVEVKGPGDNLSETQRVWIDVLLGAGVDVELCRVYEHGKMPTHIKNHPKGTLRRHSASRKRISGGSIPATEASIGESGNDPEELNELESPSDDETDTTAGKNFAACQGQDNPAYTYVNQSLEPDAPSPLTTQGQSTEPKVEHNPEKTPVSSSDVHVAESGGCMMLPHYAHTSLLRPITSLPAPILPPHSSKPILENIDSAISDVTLLAQPLNRETVVPETPRPTQRQSLARGSSADLGVNAGQVQFPELYRARRLNAAFGARPLIQPTEQSDSTPKKGVADNEEWCDTPKKAPSKNSGKEEDIGSNGDLLPRNETTPKRKHRDSRPQASARRVVSTSAMVDMSEEPASGRGTDETTRTLRKRRRMTSEGVGVSRSPSEWEKKWPEVFPQWVGDLDGSSDPDYEPSQ